MYHNMPSLFDSSIRLRVYGQNMYCLWIRIEQSHCSLYRCDWTPILLEPKLISLCHQYTVRSAHPCSLTRLYNVGRPSSSSHLDIPKNDNILFEKFRKFSRIRVKGHRATSYHTRRFRASYWCTYHITDWYGNVAVCSTRFCQHVAVIK